MSIMSTCVARQIIPDGFAGGNVDLTNYISIVQQSVS